MKHKVSEITGAELDAAVALALSTIDPVYAAKYGNPIVGVGCALVGHGRSPEDFHVAFHGAPAYIIDSMAFSPTTKWEHGGPIKTREKIASWWDGETWRATHPDSKGDGGYYPCNGGRCGTAIDMNAGDGMAGSTELEASMRTFVQAKFGDEVEL